MKNLPEERKALITILLSTLTLDSIEELKDYENFYKHSLKNKGNLFLKELESITNKNIPLIWGIHDETFYSILNSYKETVSLLIEISPEDLIEVSQLLKDYIKNK